MAYANSVLFFGWLNDDVNEVLGKLIDPKYADHIDLEIAEDSDDPLNERDAKVSKVNEDIITKGIPLNFDIFRDGIQSDTYEYYLYFDKRLENQSCNDDDIATRLLTLTDVKRLLDLSTEFDKNHPGLPPPEIITMVVSDTK